MGGQLSGGQFSGGQLSGGQLSGGQLSGGQLSRYPSSYVWLCKSCKESGEPNASRKRKTPHDSVNITDPAILSRLNADTISSSQVSSPRNETLESFKQNQEKLNLNDLNSKLDKVVRERVCEKYKRGKCPHGLRGKKEHDGRVCEFEHPRYCDKYCRFGTQRKFGCNKGSSCNMQVLSPRAL